jgi:hypothetical protein
MVEQNLCNKFYPDNGGTNMDYPCVYDDHRLCTPEALVCITHEEVRLDITFVTGVQRTWYLAKKNYPFVKLSSH